MAAIAYQRAYQNLQTFVDHNQDITPSLYRLKVVEGQLASYQTCGFMRLVELICIYVADFFCSLFCYHCELPADSQGELIRRTLRESVQVMNTADLSNEEEQAFNDLALRFNRMVSNEDAPSCIQGLYHKIGWDLGADVQNLNLRREPTQPINDEEIEEGEGSATELDLSFRKLTDDDLRGLLEERPNLQKMKLRFLDITGEAFSSDNIRFENLTELDLSTCKNLTDDNLRVLLQKSPNLQTLKLDWINITGEAFASDNITFENLTEIHFDNNKNFSDYNLKVLLEKCPNLQTLKLNSHAITSAVFDSENIRFERFIQLGLSFSGNLTDDNLRVLLEKCRNLQSLKLSSYEMTDAVFDSENIRFEKLIELDLSCCRNLTDDHLRVLLEKCRNLQTVKLYSLNMTGEAFASDHIRFENLTELDLSCCEKLTNGHLRVLLEKCRNLQAMRLYMMFVGGAVFDSNHMALQSLSEINLIKCPNLSDNIWALIEKCPHIQKINVQESGSMTGPTFTSNNIRFENLTEIRFDNCKDLTDGTLRALLEKSPHIQRLDLQHAEKITGAAFISNNITLENLTELNLTECRHLTDGNLRVLLEKCPNLQKLNLSNTESIIGAAFRSNQITLDNLTEFGLSGCRNLTDDNLRVLLSKCPHLQRLKLVHAEEVTGAAFRPNNITFENLTELELVCFRSLEDDNLAVLIEKCPRLRKINLSAADKITGAAFISDNIMLDNLTELDLSFCKNLSADHLTGLIEKSSNLTKIDLKFTEKVTHLGVEKIANLEDVIERYPKIEFAQSGYSC